MTRLEKYGMLLLAVYLILFLFKKTGIYLPIVSDYLADLIALPFTLITSDTFMRRILKKKWEISLIPMLVAVVYFSLVFEVWMPKVSSNYTADIIDVFCYLTGGIIFLLMKKKWDSTTQAF